MAVPRALRAQLLQQAIKAKERAYARYSKFHVGAALMADDGSVFEGCNVENSSYSLTICAERNAVFHAVASGKTSFRAIAIASDDPNPLTPCGACRQVLSEFAPDIEIILTGARGTVKVTSLRKLFPEPTNLKKLSRRVKKR